MVKRRGSDWSNDRYERLAAAYQKLKQDTWKPLAEELGEPWELVEKKVSLIAYSARVAY